MAETDAKRASETVQNNEKNLKYLDFMQLAAIYVVVCFSTLYEYAKENSGPLKPGVQTVEDTVKTVIGPVYEKFHDVPSALLKFVDCKVDDSINELNRHVPPLVKQVSNQVLWAVHKAPEVARAIVSEVQRVGIVDAARNITKNLYAEYEPAAKELYLKYEPVAEQYTVSAWRSLNRLPLFPQVAHVLVATSAYCAEKYNQAVTYARERHYTVSAHLPLVPIQKIAKMFEGPDEGPTVSTDGAVVLPK